MREWMSIYLRIFLEMIFVEKIKTWPFPRIIGYWAARSSSGLLVCISELSMSVHPRPVPVSSPESDVGDTVNNLQSPDTSWPLLSEHSELHKSQELLFSERDIIAQISANTLCQKVQRYDQQSKLFLMYQGFTKQKSRKVDIYPKFENDCSTVIIFSD